MNKKFSLKKRAASLILLLLPFLASSQNSITGKTVSVKDQSPIAGVSVVIKRTRAGTATAADGSFNLPA
ncbi:MAG TPA: hypothetical protein VKA49_13565 [Flavitalea sp.]|nr:hypothetical protein [Flavitalea sp.]